MSEDSKSGSLVERVTEHIENLRPLVQADGGDIDLVSVAEDTGVVSIRFQGACRGCPGAASTTATLWRVTMWIRPSRGKVNPTSASR